MSYAMNNGHGQPRYNPNQGPNWVDSLSRLAMAFFDAVHRLLGDDRSKVRVDIQRGAHTPDNRPSVRRSIMGYIDHGRFKLERARRMATIGQQTGSAMRTIKLTKHAIRRFPRNSRYLVQNYGRVLRDARKRIISLNSELHLTERHLRHYNPRALHEQVAQLQRQIETSMPSSERAELEMILDARRDLLESVLTLEDRFNELSAQLGSITAALEVNHIRVVSLGGHTTSNSQHDVLTARMQEASEQLALLEASLRERL